MIQSFCSRSGYFKLLPLLFKFFALAAFIAGMAVSSKAQDKVELFGGYSYFRASIEVGQTGPLGPGTACPPNCGTPPHVAQNANLNGWEFSGQYKFLPFLGVVADFNGTYGKLDGAASREQTYLRGPQVSLPLKFSPFAHALFGFARESQDPFLNGDSTAWARAHPGPALSVVDSTGASLPSLPFGHSNSITCTRTCTGHRKISRAFPPASSSTSS